MYVSYSNIVAQDRWTIQNCAIENQTGKNYYDGFDKSEKTLKTKKVKKE